MPIFVCCLFCLTYATCSTDNYFMKIKRRCHSVVCLRPCLRPDDREVALKIGKGNHNIADLITVTQISARYKFLNYYHYF